MRPAVPSTGPGLKPRDRSLAWISLTSSRRSGASLGVASTGAGGLSAARAAGAGAASTAGVSATLAAGDGESGDAAAGAALVLSRDDAGSGRAATFATAGQAASRRSRRGRRCPLPRSPPRRHSAPRSAGARAPDRMPPRRRAAPLLRHLDRPPVAAPPVRPAGAPNPPGTAWRLRRPVHRPCRKPAAARSGLRCPAAPCSSQDLPSCDRQSWTHPFRRRHGLPRITPQ